MKGMTKRLVVLASATLFAAAMLVGCGSDGASGVNGRDGVDGKDGQDAVVAVKAAESCNVCHGEGKTASVDAAHGGVAKYGDLVVSNITPAVVGADLVVTFNVKVNGVNKTNYNELNIDYRLDGPTKIRYDLSASGRIATLTGGTGGNYTITIAGGAAEAAVNSRYLFRIQNTAEAALASASRPAGYRALVEFDYPAAPVTDLLGSTSTSCADCHGSYGNGFHYGYPSNGGRTCVVCHDSDQIQNGTTGALSATNYPRLPEMIHGIHQSGNMPTGLYTVTTRNYSAGPPEVGSKWDYAIHFPSYMSNCSICHQSGASLTAANTEAFSYNFCVSCHQNWNGFGDSPSISFHTNMTAATNCTGCHNGTVAATSNVGEVHNKANAGLGLITGRSGLIVSGQDLSVVEGDKIALEITGVTRAAGNNNLAITWTAKYDGAAVNPCNATATTTAPAFAYVATTASATQRALSAQNLSILKAFFLGDDLVNADNGATSPGQALNTALNFTAGTGNTSCSANIATTTIALTDKEAALTGKARIAIQGKPQMVTAAGVKHLVRAKTPVYDFDLATGAKAADRRPVTDSEKCLKCHVGSLYQHGGNRIDNVEMCVMCHNEASNEQNNRVAMGVTKAESYDGKVGQTYGFKSMLHAVHASGTPGFSKPIAFYRSNGIYTFAFEEAALFNWTGIGTAKTVFGSDPAVTRNHYFVVAHYPRPLQDCLACHTSNFTRIPDPTKAVGTTLDAGASPWDNQLDDTIQGPVAAACTSCHSSAATSAHANQFGWTPAVLEKGRQTVIDTANE